MKRFTILAALIGFLGTASFALAGYDLNTIRIDDQTAETASGLTSSFLIPVYDTTAKDVDFIAATDIYGLGSAKAGSFTTVTATGAVALSGAATTQTRAPAADSAATNLGVELDFSTPVDTTGTNSHIALFIDPTIGNATGGTNVFKGLLFDNITGDSQVTETALDIGTGYDVGADFNSPVNIDAALNANGDVIGDGADQLYGFLQDQVASTTVSTTAAQCGKTFVSNSADVMTLPEASTVLGCRYTFVCGTADDLDINPADGTDVIGTVASITGTNTTTVLAPSAGDAVRCTDIGSSITIEAVAADLWVSVGNANGIWTDVN
jgi:hypothetical protein